MAVAAIVWWGGNVLLLLCFGCGACALRGGGVTVRCGQSDAAADWELTKQLSQRDVMAAVSSSSCVIWLSSKLKEKS
jgi:hypothetical protein